MSNAYYAVECLLLPRFKRTFGGGASSTGAAATASQQQQAPRLTTPRTPMTPATPASASSSSSSSSSESDSDTNNEDYTRGEARGGLAYKPIFSARAWMEAPAFRIEAESSSGGNSTPFVPHLLHAAGLLAEAVRMWTAGGDADVDGDERQFDDLLLLSQSSSKRNGAAVGGALQPVRDLNVSAASLNNNSAALNKSVVAAGGGVAAADVLCPNSGRTVRRHIIWARDRSSASVTFAPIGDAGGDFIFAVRVANAQFSVTQQQQQQRVFAPLTEHEVSEFADHCLFVLTTDVALHTIVPQGWLGGQATASGRDRSVPLRTLLSSRTFLHDTRRRIEVCCAWWLNQVRRNNVIMTSSSLGTTTRLVETTSSALRAAGDTTWAEKLHFALQSKFHLPFSVTTSPLTWTPNQVAPSPHTSTYQNPASSGDTTTRFVEDGWLILQDRHVVGASPLLDDAKRAALFHCSTLVGSSVQELVTHIGDLCAAPPPSDQRHNQQQASNSLSKPVIPPVVIFDVDVTGWLLAAPRMNTTLDPFASGNTHSNSNNNGNSNAQLQHPFKVTSTVLPGWQDTTATNTVSDPVTTKQRVVVASSAGGAFAPKGFSIAFLLTSSHIPFVGIPLTVARDVARSAISEASAMWEEYTQQRTPGSNSNNAPNPELRHLFDQHGVLLHATMCCTAADSTSSSSGSSNCTNSTTGLTRSYLVGGGTVGAIRLSLGAPRPASVDKTLDGSRQLNEIISKAHFEIYGPCRRGVAISTPFHEEVLSQMLASGLLSNYAAVSRRQGVAASTRQVMTLSHPAIVRGQMTDKETTRRVLAVVAPEKGDVLSTLRVVIFSVPKETVSEAQSLHLGRLLPIY